MRISQVFYLVTGLAFCLLILTIVNYGESLKAAKIGQQEYLFTALLKESDPEYNFILVVNNDDSIEYDPETFEDKSQLQDIIDQSVEPANEPIDEPTNEPINVQVTKRIEEAYHPIAVTLNHIQAQSVPKTKLDRTEAYRRSVGRKKEHMYSRQDNIFYLLGAYPEIHPPFVRPEYNISQYGLLREEDYCERVDRYNLDHPENIFKQMNLYTDFQYNAFARYYVFRKIANITTNQISKPNTSQFHHHYRVGQEFLCATQTYNHVPGQSILVSKDTILDSLSSYLVKYESRPQCFRKNMMFPLSYRLDNKTECESFFNIINSQEYQDRIKAYPFQYLIKISRNFHQSSGVYLLDEDLTKYLIYEYQLGAKCDSLNHPLMTQTYLANPLLLDFDNKFDFRMYMLIASTNPLMVYYHDGFLRVSLNPFDKFSKDKATHMTNTHLSDKILKAAKANNMKIYGMDPKELQDYTWWSLEDFQTYLLDTARITDPDWLDNYLRPAFKRCMIHLVRMARDYLWNQSNVYALHGVDFMLDDDLNLWFIETNPSPQLGSPSQEKSKIYKELLFDMFDITQSLYRSRMKRVYAIINKMELEKIETGSYDLDKWRPQYQEAVKNRFESEYKPKVTNSYQMIIDENLPEVEAYFGHLDENCL